MQIVVNEQLKDAIEWTCKYASEYKVDIDIHIDADGEVSVSVCPTYRHMADTPQTDCNGCEHWKYIAHEWQCETTKCQGYTPKTEPQTDLVEDSDDLVKDLVKDTPQMDYKDGEEYLRGYKQGIEDEINKHHVGR
jgi:hypothetical protein